MKFYDRAAEISALKRIEKNSAEYAQMTVITGFNCYGMMPFS